MSYSAKNLITAIFGLSLTSSVLALNSDEGTITTTVQAIRHPKTLVNERIVIVALSH